MSNKLSAKTEAESGNRPRVMYTDKYGLMFTGRYESRKAKKNGHVTCRECAAMRLLYRDGWDKGILAMVFQLSNTSAVGRHVYGRCSHNLPVQSVAQNSPTD